MQPLLQQKNNNYYILECVFVAYNAHEPYCCLWLAGFAVFFYLTSHMALFSKNTIEHKIFCYDFLYNFCLKYFSF